MGDPVMGDDKCGVKFLWNSTGRQQAGPPSRPDAEDADRKKAEDADDEDEEQDSKPTEAKLGCLTAAEAGLADVGGECGPIFFFGGLAGGPVGGEEALCPVVLIKSDGTGVAAHNSLVEDAAGKLTKAFLLQRQEVVLADFGDRRDFFQRNAARHPLHAQVFSEAAHRKPDRVQGPYGFSIQR